MLAARIATRSVPLRLEQVLFEGKAGGGGSRGDVQLAVDGGEMPVAGARADDQLSVME